MRAPALAAGRAIGYAVAESTAMQGTRWIRIAAWMLVVSCGAATRGGGSPVPDESLADGGADGEVLDAPPAPPPGPPLPPGSAPLVERARTNLQRRMALGSPDDVRVVSVEAVEWADAGLDCHDLEMSYAQVVTPGFLIILEAAERRFEYHADTNYSIILCEEGRPVRGGL
jgi:hypothetical protein